MKKINDNIDRSWIDKTIRPFVISGPCSAENENQMIFTAKKLNSPFIKAFRSGIWKPRTKPGNFEGVGKKGLIWMKNVKKMTGLMTATEVANEEHTNLCISFDVDILWIGARSTASPFTIQEIAESLQENKNKIVLLKNPIHPDMDLWMGAVERFYNKGIKKLGLIHRGFYTYKSLKYRNQPNWKMLLEVKKILPRIPIFCDPSHICGKKEGISEVAKKAYYYFNCEGLMIETHFDPKNAWSDAKQQITPEHLSKMLEFFISSKKEDLKETTLNLFRTLIDELDENILSIISERMSLSKDLGSFKKSLDIMVLQPNRLKSIMHKYINMGKNLEIREEFIKKFFKLLHEESMRIQNKIRN